MGPNCDVRNDAGRKIAKTFFPSLNGRTDEYMDECRANGHLIAAAPELYEALDNLVTVIEKAGIHNLMTGVQLGQVSWAIKADDAKAYATEALAKARGES